MRRNINSIFFILFFLFTIEVRSEQIKLQFKNNLDDILKRENKEDEKKEETAEKIEIKKEIKEIKENIPVPKVNFEEKKSSDGIKIYSSELKVVRGVIAKKVESSTPVEVASVFPLSIDKLYCYTEVTGVNPGIKIYHSWYYKDKLINSVELVLNRERSYTWSFIAIPSGYSGEWEVHILSEEGKLIANIPFKIE